MAPVKTSIKAAVSQEEGNVIQLSVEDMIFDGDQLSGIGGVSLYHRCILCIAAWEASGHADVLDGVKILRRKPTHNAGLRRRWQPSVTQ